MKGKDVRCVVTKDGTFTTLSLEVRVHMKWETDHDPDLSHFGEYTDEEGDGVLERAKYGIKVSDRQCRYFKPANHWPHNPKNWDHVSGEEKVKLIKKHGSLQNVDLHYAVEDMKRMEAYNNGEWWMEFCKVTVSVGKIAASDALHGIENDSGDKYRREVERDCLGNALAILKEKVQKRLEVE